jgi:hypothetical protein
MDMDHDRTKPAWKKSDLYLMAGCLLAALVCCGLWLLLRKDGLAVAVELEGKASARYALNEDRIVRIEGTEGYNTLVIEGGEAWLSEADCPNLLCVKTGKIRYAGQSIVCLPHKLTVRIVGGASALDAVTGP